MREKGSMVQRYVIEKVLGKGAFGVVYQVKHVTLNYRVALKEFFPQGYATLSPDGIVYPHEHQQEVYDTSLEKFTKECRVLMHLEHKNIVYAYDCFLLNGTAYLVMHQECGSTLLALLHNRLTKTGKPFDWQEIKPLIKALLDSLSYMHRQNIFHRDIKPSNIIVRRSDNSPVLIDFGSAKIGAGNLSIMAQASEGFCGFEQVYDWPIGTWTDVHALSMTILCLLSGQMPPTVEERLSALMKKRPLPETDLFNRLEGQVPIKVLNALKKGTEPYPENRTTTMLELQTALF